MRPTISGGEIADRFIDIGKNLLEEEQEGELFKEEDQLW